MLLHCTFGQKFDDRIAIKCKLLFYILNNNSNDITNGFTLKEKCPLQYPIQCYTRVIPANINGKSKINMI
jgi:hypothetical protein